MEEQDIKLSLALIAQKLDYHNVLLLEHIRKDELFQSQLQEALDGCDQYPGVRGRLDRLEQAEKTRLKHFYIIYTALIGSVLSWFGVHK